MPTPALTSSVRYTDLDTSEVYWVPSIAATNLTPTRAELDAGLNLSGELNDQSGWSVEAEFIDTQSMGESFRSRIPGSTQAPDSSLTLYASRTGSDIRGTLERGDAGFVCWMDGGDVAGQKMETFPVIVASLALMRTATGGEATKIMVSFSITRQPGTNLTIPA